MGRRISILTFIVCVLLFLVNTGWADVPPPPVNQDIGFPDIAFGGLSEADCRVCHDSGLPDRHHLLYGQPIPSGSIVPYPDSDGDGNPDTVYVCLSCHDQDFNVVRDCTVCHTGSSPHHATPDATSGYCSACHGSVVDDYDDGHYIPTYTPSLVTPEPGDCSDCHAGGTDTGSGYDVLGIQELHHNTGLTTCTWCHDMGGGTEPIRLCERCHGPDSLHNIQADSPNVNNIGTIIVGGEDAGYGHVGRDAGPGDSDCWGCHDFEAVALAPFSGPIAPTIYDVRPAVAKTGTNTLVSLTGSALTNTTGDVLFESEVVLTAADGSAMTLTPGVIYEGLLKFTIPGSTAPGNYSLRAVKSDDEGKPVPSNPIAFPIIPKVNITDVTISDGITIIKGSGFAGYAEGSGTSVAGKTGTTIVEAKIVSWSDTVIKADFGTSPESVTVNSVFGTDTYQE